MRVSFTAKTWNNGSAIATPATDIFVANLKEGQRVFRYETDVTRAGGLKPLILIDLVRELCYFLKDVDDETVCFESKGTKIRVHSINMEV